MFKLNESNLTVNVFAGGDSSNMLVESVIRVIVFMVSDQVIIIPRVVYFSHILKEPFIIKLHIGSQVGFLIRLRTVKDEH